MTLGLAYMVTTPQTRGQGPLQQLRLLHRRDLRRRHRRREDRLEQHPAAHRVRVEPAATAPTRSSAAATASTTTCRRWAARPGPYQNPPYANAYAFTATTSRRCARSRPASPTTASRSIRTTTAATGRPSTPNFKQGRVQQWSLNVERKLPFSTVAQHRLRRHLRRPAVRQEPQPEHGDARARASTRPPVVPIPSCRPSSPPSAAAG